MTRLVLVAVAIVALGALAAAASESGGVLIAVGGYCLALVYVGWRCGRSLPWPRSGRVMLLLMPSLIALGCVLFLVFYAAIHGHSALD